MQEIVEATALGLDNCLSLWGQPVVPLQGQGESHQEILLRCSGQQQIQSLISAYEHYHLSPVIDYWVLRESLRHLRASPESCFAINLSPYTLKNSRAILNFSSEVRRAGIKPRRLKIELTERYQLPWGSDAVSALLFLKGEGFEIWLDDYGEGYCLADMTDRVRPYGIKLPGSFIRRIQDEKFYRLVKRVVDIAHDFGCQVTAEWIETEQILRLAREIGFDWGQGYFLGMPAPLPRIPAAHPTA